jgi:uncharacterized membrane protein
MNWLQKYRIVNYFRSSIWIPASCAIILAILGVRLLNFVEVRFGLMLEYNTSTSMTVMGTLASSMFTLLIFVCSSLLIVVQLAGAQLTPRFIGMAFNTPIIKISLAMFVFTFTFTLDAILRIDDKVPVLSAYVAVMSCLFSVGFFIYMVDKVGKTLRPSGALKLVSRMGHEVIREVYPNPVERGTQQGVFFDIFPEKTPISVLQNKREGVLLAFNAEGLVAVAKRYGCIIELVPQVGEFVATGQALFRIYTDRTPPPSIALSNNVVLGPERTLQQDPAFAFRIMVDIASKGLSPAINDPTTAVLAIDQVHHLLRELGQRRLDEGFRKDSDGDVRFVYHTPDWEDFVYLAVTEIRHFGGSSIQIARRLRAMLENLISSLPEERVPVLRMEQALLEKAAKRLFYDHEDQALAEISDFQGVGGKKDISSRKK